MIWAERFMILTEIQMIFEIYFMIFHFSFTFLATGQDP